jgi:TolB-like protein
MSQQPGTVYAFGEFQVEPGKRRLLHRDGEHVALTPKAFDTLLHLVEHSGQVLDKEDLMAAVWPDTAVEQNNLTQCISTLRRVLGERCGEHQFIVTVPGRGYRFVADVITRTNTGQPGALDHRPPTSDVTIAVLPFTNISADAENEYFCDGLAEELTNALAKLDRMRVVARTSAHAFKGKQADVREIGRKLGVGTVLEGSVRKSGDRLRITVQLVNVADGYHLWSEGYDRRMQDIFDIQDEITLAVVAALKVRLLGAEKAAVLKRHTASPEAYHLYLKGRFYWYKATPDDLLKSRDYFQRAIDCDPAYALGYCGLGFWAVPMRPPVSPAPFKP